MQRMRQCDGALRQAPLIAMVTAITTEISHDFV
jgi:hypothetical protein